MRAAITRLALIMLFSSSAMALQVDDYGATFDTTTHGMPLSVSMQSNNKAILVTRLASNHFKVMRLNEDSSIDTTFNEVDISLFRARVEKPFILGNDKIILYGEFNNFRGDDAYGIVRLDENGNTEFLYDSNQYSAHLSDQNARAIAQDYEGRLLVSRPRGIERWTNADLRDPDFELRLYRNGTSPWATSILPRIDGRILVTHSAHWIKDSEGNIPVKGIAEFLPNGDALRSISISNDLTSHVSAGHAPSGFISGSALIPRISSGDTLHPLGKLNFDNSIASNFNIAVPAGQYVPNRHSVILIQDDASLIIPISNLPGAGGSTLMKFNSDGSLDPDFNMQGGVTTSVYGASQTYFGIQSVAQQTSGEIIIVGGFDTVMGIARPGIARISRQSQCPAT
ncbi:hypothetical protein [Isoalcanivorax indicus]|uniref:hypothetical protein n=1 Tax=Isoalcanivorax indicus TaxID=2202653 RepID=UPI000DB98620|nr:hypothetical protein [Isoalcanivorax indicus]